MRAAARIAATATCLLPSLAAACTACQGIVNAEVLSQFWRNFGIAASPFAVFGIVAAAAYKIR